MKPLLQRSHSFLPALQLGLSGLVLAAVSFTPPDPDPIEPVPVGVPAENPSLPWPPELGVTGKFRRIVAGRLLDEQMGVAVVLRGTTPVAVVEPHNYSAFFVVNDEREFLDLAIYPRTGDVDLLIGATTDGLFAYEFDALAGAFVESQLGSSVWEDCPRVRVGDADGTAGLDVVGLSSDRLSFLRLLSGSGGSDLSTFSESVVTAPHLLLEFVLDDFYPGGPIEMVAHTDDGLHVFKEAQGEAVSLYRVRTLHPGGALARIERNGTEVPETGAAWFVPTPSDDAFLIEYVTRLGIDVPIQASVPDPDGGAGEVDLDVFDAVSADWDGDGFDDLLACNRDFERATVFLNQGAPKHFKKSDPGEHLAVIDLAEAPQPDPDNECVPAFFDLDNSGNAEIVSGVDRLGAIEVDGLVSETEAILQSVSGSEAVGPGVPGFHASSSRYEFDPGTLAGPEDDVGTLVLVFDDVPESLLSDWEYLQVVEWSQDDPSVSGPYVDAVALRNDLYSIGADTTTNQRNIEIEFSHELYGGTLNWTDARHAYLQLRFVNADEMGSEAYVTDFTPSVVLGLTIDPGAGPSNYLAYLEGLHGGPAEIEIFEALAEGSTQPPAGVTDNGVGAVFILGNLPPFQPGAPPNAKRPSLSPAFQLNPGAPQ